MPELSNSKEHLINLEGARVFDAIPVLSSMECERVRQTVHALRTSWTVRLPPSKRPAARTASPVSKRGEDLAGR
jgi:hypothetical protein